MILTKTMWRISVLIVLAATGCGKPEEVAATKEPTEQAGTVADEAETQPVLTPAERIRAERKARLTVAEVTVVEGRCRLCPEPDCGEGKHLSRIPAGMVIQVEDVATVRLPRWAVLWFKVSYQGKAGWISEFCTSAAPPEPRYY